MDINNEKQYIFKVSESNLDQIHSDLATILSSLPSAIYDESLICLHELVINSMKEMRTIHKEDQYITIDLMITNEEAVICLKDLGRGLSQEQISERDQNPLRETGRGLDIITLLADWFCVFPESNCCNSYYVIKKICS
ncbi:MAG: Histidine kinaselike ATPase domain [Lachnospiraceae bacterium]|jgi:hypothetical protein|nr:Histidine kinaselike ATPase domain [Lachnospiraceae bacterium]